MKCLEISNGKAWFLNSSGSMTQIDKITKEDILFLLDIAVDSSKTFDMDEIEKSNLSNEAHKIIYKNLYSKFDELLENKNRF